MELFFFSSRRRHTRCGRDWSSDVCSSDLNQLRALLDIIDFKRELKINYPVIVGGYDAYKVADQLKDAEIPIIIKGGHTLPETKMTQLTYLGVYLPYFKMREYCIAFKIQGEWKP